MKTELFRPHRLLLARFLSRGLIAAAIVTLAVSAVLTTSERDNYLRYVMDSARERAARLAVHIGHQIASPAASIAHTADGPAVADTFAPYSTPLACDVVVEDLQEVYS